MECGFEYFAKQSTFSETITTLRYNIIYYDFF